MVLTSVVALSTALLQPANFECDLLLISTSRYVVEGDEKMNWLRSELIRSSEPELMSPPSESEIGIARIAARELNAKEHSTVVIDGAALKTNYYSPFKRKYLNIMATAGDPKAFKVNEALVPYSIPIEDQGYSIASFYQEPVTRAQGPVSDNRSSWPTFTLIPLNHQLTAPAAVPFRLKDDESLRKLALNVSPTSVIQAAELIDKSDPNYKQICICAWGTQIPGRPNLIAFPPNGRAVRYKFGHKDGKWFAKFVKAY